MPKLLKQIVNFGYNKPYLTFLFHRMSQWRLSYPSLCSSKFRSGVCYEQRRYTAYVVKDTPIQSTSVKHLKRDIFDSSECGK